MQRKLIISTIPLLVVALSGLAYVVTQQTPAPPTRPATQRLNLDTEQIIVSAKAATVQQALTDAVNEAFGLCLLEHDGNAKGIIDAMTSTRATWGVTIIIAVHCRDNPPLTNANTSGKS